jgi:hypothetical protein
MQKSSGAKVIAIAVSPLFVGIAVLVVRSYLRGSTPDEAYYTTYICTETGRAFKHRNEPGETLPIVSPYSGKNTGVPGEPCYWTADGRIKSQPTWVLLNEAIGKPGATFCPDCGRLVVGRNPVAHAGGKPPPTEDEYAARRTLHDGETSRDDDR